MRNPHPFNSFTSHQSTSLLVSDVHSSSPGYCLSQRYVCAGLRKVVSRQARKSRGCVKRSTETAVSEHELDCAEQLARFFPGAAAVRVPVQVTALRGGRAKLREATVLEFGGAQNAIFLSTLPLEFEDRVRLERDSHGGAAADATVVAVQYHKGRKAVAVKFTQGLCDWVMQP
jgi:hypothetical protein